MSCLPVFGASKADTTQAKLNVECFDLHIQEHIIQVLTRVYMG